MGRPLGSAPEAAPEDLGLPPEGQVRRSCSCLGRRGSGSTRSSGGLAAQAAGNSALEGHGNQYWPVGSSILAWRTPSLTEKPGRPQCTGSRRVGLHRSDPAGIDAKLFLPVAALAQWRWRSCLVSRDPVTPSVEDTDCLRGRSYGPLRVLL